MSLKYKNGRTKNNLNGLKVEGDAVITGDVKNLNGDIVGGSWINDQSTKLAIWTNTWSEASRTLTTVGDIDPQDPLVSYRGTSGGAITMGATVGEMTMYGTAPRHYIDGTFVDVVITGSYKRGTIDAGNPGEDYSGLNIGIRSDPDGHGGGNPANTTYFRMRHDQSLDVGKELTHPTIDVIDSKSYAWNVNEWYSFKMRLWNSGTITVNYEFTINGVIQLSGSFDDTNIFNASGGNIVIRNTNIAGSNTEHYKDLVITDNTSTNFIYNTNVGVIGIGKSVPNPKYKIDMLGDFHTSSNLLIDGNVGVNNSNPEHALHIKGATPNIVIQPDDNTTGSLIFKNNGNPVTETFHIEFDTTKQNLLFRSDSNNCLYMRQNGNVAIGEDVISPLPSKILEVRSTTSGVMLPKMTTVQRDAISSVSPGEIIYDTTTNKLQCYNGSTWNNLF